MGRDYFVRIKGQNFGPVKSADLKRMALEGRIDADTPVRRGNLKKWYKAKAFGGLFDQFNDNAPPLQEGKLDQSAEQEVDVEASASGDIAGDLADLAAALDDELEEDEDRAR